MKPTMRLSLYRNHILRFSSIVLLATWALVCSADRGKLQNRNELERQRKQKEREIAQTKKRLAETNQKEKKTLAYLNDLTQLIEERQSLIGTLQNQLGTITQHIGEEAGLVVALDEDVANLKAEYTKLLYYMYKNRKATSTISFIFSTNSFNESLKRIKFIQFYTDYRQKQVDLILKTEASLSSRITDLKSQQEAKKEVLASLANEEKSLESDKREQSALMVKLKQDAKGLKRQLASQQRAARQLDNAIRNAIKKEIALANKRAKVQNKSRPHSQKNTIKPKPGVKEEMETTPEVSELSAKFASNRSRLPWPVDRGTITEHFGTHEHPTISKVIVNRNGVLIKAANGSKARCIFGGTVSAVVSIPGANTSILVNHGNYFTVYTNLENVTVHRGEKISLKQEIGTVGINPITGECEIELEIWKGDQKLDPEGWILRR
jgi:septal ring factor EnvC (AmiA/AmiB activator)